MENKNGVSSFIKIFEELQGKFDKVFEYVQNLRNENESLKQKISLLEAEIDALRRENEEMRKNGIVLFSPDEREEFKRKVSALLERLNRYL
ncbi:Protein of unknown function (DUF904) [Candidatus Kryptobacter tengchongensis]|uniref:cell division protein ZapB n=1 Tax=Kryptobacter tengchongensis TaxID=1643429 RepID=UPI0007073B83|nr:cell division protein ZapB [Candidatus Kryptobacter tengchongensis]CUS80021.1 Protein of unknown function (DUF904) [Candidatus Kryptobacter tengchongensis]CUS97358.1 Protein of unknown function (DUF904) [Candidatus Kryptobacter tengchongensis]CUU05475.1 Protein of unknown function (DUF904) [Candidatus Kryptobacter tengchongensis]CUU09913.1 Protein of unknown function (DUF904) [Candidatus Kryptobacter tengchongensis]